MPNIPALKAGRQLAAHSGNALNRAARSPHFVAVAGRGRSTPANSPPLGHDKAHWRLIMHGFVTKYITSYTPPL